MIRTGSKRLLGLNLRLFSTGPKLFAAQKLTPAELLQQKTQEKLQQQEFEKSLLQGELEYKPKYLSENAVKGSGTKPIPINVELLKYKPIRLPKTHGHKVVSMKFRGYDETDINIAIEFASRAAFYLGIPVSGIMKQKTEKRLYTVIKSPFAQAKSKENFYRTTFNYKLDAFDANPEVVDLWLSYVNKHALETVHYTAKIITRESANFVEQLDSVSVEDVKIPEGFKDSNDPIMSKVDELLKSDAFKKHMDQ
ncbi:mitochondrial 37S ribosomal protein rsm10 [Yamadazyma tenuis]|uniref:Ribosomal protein S10 n=1 Tax=Candida tenuis (strain ATCC 10573 / BCRC 21748 / CBS 615 / JCM 9827 / NBRC 10315 / NRRL Y-1498 / VKM Y-70) TaxID=590646 RepID=G3BCP5_CANTC|nr:ribosomal protein S10 [Yamadazyma tenuis ATCC 10573]EGV60846.1 ribosomal protein S10 [Yamadazyma tenuis ATCC 10573]WEJ93883.1 mitochondrial 37S ribosomal protein rsm10 [Yamadazyma tenuis]